MKYNENNENEFERAILNLFGDSFVGKSCLKNSLMKMDFKNDYIPTQAPTTETEGINFTLNNGKKIPLTLWDISGQEKYRPLVSLIAKNSHGIILVFDLTNRKSFEDIDIWLNLIKEKLTNKNLVLFGNKCDIGKEQWQVTRKEVDEYAKKNNLKYFETSAKTNQGIYEGISYIVNEAYATFKENTKNNMPHKISKDIVIVDDPCLGKKKIVNGVKK